MTDDNVPGWTAEHNRADGMTVAKSIEDTWIVKPPDDRPMITLCTCCARPFRTAVAAMRVANVVYPARSGSES